MDIKLEEMGKRLRMIRRGLLLTLEQSSEETGISRSYLSDFETGKRLVTTKYLKYLFEQHNINLNYIFLPDQRMFRANEEEELVRIFENIPDIKDLLLYIRKIPHARFMMLTYFCQYKIENEMLVRKYLKKIFPKKEGNPTKRRIQ
jgi:transcriptional regulator with XRE-family HTH domain